MDMVFKVFKMIGMLSSELTAAGQDGKITVREALNIMEKICDALDVELDKEGVEV